LIIKRDSKEYSRTWRQANKEWIKKYEHDRYEKHREKELVESKEYYHKHREERLVYLKKYREQHKQEAREWFRKYQRTGKYKEGRRRYRETHREQIQERKRKYRQTVAYKNMVHKYEKLLKTRKRRYAEKKARRLPLGELCEFCDEINGLVRHHPDYNLPEIYVTCCFECHKWVHLSQDPEVSYIIDNYF